MPNYLLQYGSLDTIQEGGNVLGEEKNGPTFCAHTKNSGNFIQITYHLVANELEFRLVSKFVLYFLVLKFAV